MGDHDLLLRHAHRWAESKGQVLDEKILETVLDLRDHHDEQRPQAWPAGSVEHLMLVRWPSHGPSEVPEPQELVATLETFWRFLRSTGRMATGSADIKSLTKEARRAAPHMAEACADPARHGATKSILEYGESIGISLDGATTVEELQERLDQVVEAWNALPVDERRRRSPGPTAHQGSAPGQRATGIAQALTAGAPFDPSMFDQPSWDDGLDEVDDEPMPRKDPGDVARSVQRSPFVQQVLRLANWVGEGRSVTATGVLRLSEARAAYEELGLHTFDEQYSQDLWGWTTVAGVAPDPREALARMRSAADLRSLDRLWSAAVAAGLVEVGPSRARQVPVGRREADDWVQLGMLCLVQLFLTLPGARDEPLFLTLLLLLTQHRVDLPELRDWWHRSPQNTLSEEAFQPSTPQVASRLRAANDALVDGALTEFEDTGVWRREGETLHQTDLGYEFAILLAAMKDQDLLDD